MPAQSSLALAPSQSEVVRRTVVVSGAPRSGTTLVGKLIASLADVEYQFEPPTFYMITAMYASGRLSIEDASALLTVYLSEDLLLESVLGRRANLRPNDDSLILNSISWSQLHSRWTDIGNREDALRWVRENSARLVVKMPNVLDAMPLLQHAIPEMQLVLVCRDGHDVVNSILSKGWVSESGLNNELWPYFHSSSSVPIPYWVSEQYRERWITMTPETRAVVMWTTHADLGLAFADSSSLPSERLIVLAYEKLVKKPAETMSDLAEALGHDMTSFTMRRLEEVRPRNFHRSDTVFRAQVEKDVLSWFDSVNEGWESFGSVRS